MATSLGLRRSLPGSTGLALLCLVIAWGQPPAAVAVCEQPSLFDDATEYITGSNPPFVTTGDFNEDGITDLAVSNSFAVASGGVGSSVSILLGQGAEGVGDGTFSFPVNYSAGSQPIGIAKGDFNGDEIIDLAVAHLDGTTLSILLGNGAGGVGDGTFAAPIDYPAGLGPFHLLTGDFDSDGITDLAASNNMAATVSILFGLGKKGVGDGTFDAPESLPLSDMGTGIASGDFNEDGITDLVATENFDGRIAVLLGQGSAGMGNGNFAPAVHYSAGLTPYDITVDDFNDDDILDLAVTNNAASGGTSILLGNGSGGVGNGTFTLQSFVPSGNSTSIVSEDFNQDGITDLAIATISGTFSTFFATYLGNGSGGIGNGTFGSGTPYSVGTLPASIATGNFNEDTLIDVAVANYLDDFISVFLAVCGGSGSGPTLTEVRDVPNDQGGKVFLTWTRNSLDEIGGPVTDYRVWRRIPPAVAGAITRFPGADWPETTIRTTEVRSGADVTNVTYWEALVTLPAQRLEGYGYTAATTQDSMVHSNPYTAFFITALTNDIDLFFDSNVDSGYSVDNLPPSGIPWFSGEYVEGTATLHWGPSSEPDFFEYRIYRGGTLDFAPGPGNFIRAQSDTGYVDAAGGLYFYKLSPVDVHGNEGPFAVLQPPGTVNVETRTPSLLVLYPSIPNPVRGNALIRFDLPSTMPVSLLAYNAQGRLVRHALPRTVKLAGRHEWLWDGRTDAGVRVPPGVYFFRLETPSSVLTRKIVVSD